MNTVHHDVKIYSSICHSSTHESKEHAKHWTSSQIDCRVICSTEASGHIILIYNTIQYIRDHIICVIITQPEQEESEGSAPPAITACRWISFTDRATKRIMCWQLNWTQNYPTCLQIFHISFVNGCCTQYLTHMHCGKINASCMRAKYI